VISNQASQEQHTQLFCSKCGAATIDKCPHCEHFLVGQSEYLAYDPFPTPDPYCMFCGKAYPWTDAKFEAMREIADYIPELTSDDRQTLVSILPDLLAKESTPRTEVGIVRMKVLLKKGGVVFATSAASVLKDVISTAVSKALFPG